MERQIRDAIALYETGELKKCEELLSELLNNASGATAETYRRDIKLWPSMPREIVPYFWIAVALERIRVGNGPHAIGLFPVSQSLDTAIKSIPLLSSFSVGGAQIHAGKPQEADPVMDIADEKLEWKIHRAIVIRKKEWKTNMLVGDYRGVVVAIIPYQSDDGRDNAMKIAKQIVAANLDITDNTISAEEN